MLCFCTFPEEIINKFFIFNGKCLQTRLVMGVYDRFMNHRQLIIRPKTPINVYRKGLLSACTRALRTNLHAPLIIVHH